MGRSDRRELYSQLTDAGRDLGRPHENRADRRDLGSVAGSAQPMLFGEIIIIIVYLHSRPHRS